MSWAKFLSHPAPPLLSLHLHIPKGTRLHVQEVLEHFQDTLTDLRFSVGDYFPYSKSSVTLSALKHMTFDGPGSGLLTNSLLHGGMICPQLSTFATTPKRWSIMEEIQDAHLKSFIVGRGTGATLIKLVLLDCSQLTTGALDECLHHLPHLQYFALSWIINKELSTNFILSLPDTLVVLKIQVDRPFSASRFLEQERTLCNTLEHHVLLRKTSLTLVCAMFARILLDENNRQTRWMHICHASGTRLQIGPWEADEII